MKVKPKYYKVFVNFLHTPESDEEYAALAAMAIRSKQAEKMQETIKELERKYEEWLFIDTESE